MTQTKKAFKDWDISDFDFANADGKTTFQFRTLSEGGGRRKKQQTNIYNSL